MNQDDKWIDENDLEAYSGFSRSYWQKQRSRGTGPAYSKIKKAVRYRLSDIVAYLESHKIRRPVDSAKDNANG